MPAQRITVKIEKNLIPNLRRQIPLEIQTRLSMSADLAREAVKDALASGNPLGNDTTSTSQGMYVATAKGSDYDQRRSAAEEAYTGNQSRYEDAVREDLGVDAYTHEHFEERAMPEEFLPAGNAHEQYVQLASLMAMGHLFELGHNNLFTGRWEHRPFFAPAILNWATREFAGMFKDLI